MKRCCKLLLSICFSQHPLNKLDVLVGTLLLIIYISAAVTDSATVGGGGGDDGIAAFLRSNSQLSGPLLHNCRPTS